MSWDEIAINIGIGLVSGVVSSLLVTIIFNKIAKSQSARNQLLMELLEVPKYVIKHFSDMYSLICDMSMPFLVKQELLLNTLMDFPIYKMIEQVYPALYEKISEFFSAESKAIKSIILAAKDGKENANAIAAKLFLEEYLEELRKLSAEIPKEATNIYLSLTPKKKAKR